MSPHPLVHKEAPTIVLPNQDGKEVTIKPGSSGKPLAVFFYPASGTFGCTKEACSFRDALKDSEIFKRSEIEIVGISGDAVTKQKEFVDQHGLPFPVLSDANGVARKAYSVKKGLLGITEGRVTFFIDSKGIVKDVLSSVINYNEHVKFVRKALEESEAAAGGAEETKAEGHEHNDKKHHHEHHQVVLEHPPAGPGPTPETTEGNEVYLAPTARLV
ncbi:thioredoxin-like protein [Hysterangium stoloniferum]|nr:thioredoxin-like protein [Hysterangium stoloniferum]